jgi:hypothetical protein
MDWTDERWADLKGGYRVVFDPRPLLLRLMYTPYADPLWHEFIGELYHQGDVGEASYAALPELAKLIPEGSPIPWQLVALVAWIENARTASGNPALPEWLEESYFKAIESLAHRCLRELSKSTTSYQTSAMLAIIALWKALRVYARALIANSEDELAEILPD